MRLATIRCPQCAATISVSEGAETARCEYCGTSSVVRRRTAYFERPIAPPKRPEYAKMPVAVQKHSGKWVMLSVLIPVLLMVAVGGVIFSVQGGMTGRVMWGGAQALVVDVNGDGVGDAVGWARYVMDDDRASLTAVDGKSGDALWESENLGKYGDLIQSKVALAGGTLIVANALGSADGFDVKSGKRKWSGATLGEKPQRLCRADDESLFVDTAGKVRKRIGAGDGSVSDATFEDACNAPPTMTANWSPGTYINKHPNKQLPQPRYFGEMGVDWTLRFGSDVWLAFGTKRKGTRVPMVVRYKIEKMPTERHQEPTVEELWSVVVPSGNPLAADPSAPSIAGVDADAVAIGYETKDDVNRIALFDLASGNRLWDAALPKKEHGSEVLSGIVVTKSRVYVSTWTRLIVLSRANAERHFIFGDL